MPTLLEKSPPVSPSAHSPVHVLRSRHRWQRWRGVLTALLIGLAATLATLAVLHPSWRPPTAWKILAPVWAGGFLLTVLAAAVAWRFAPASLADTAQSMDRNLAAKNRLEAIAALRDSTTPLARAQREETAAYLEREARARPVRVFPWLIAVVIALVVAHVSMLALWVLPSLPHPAAPALPPPPKEPPRASIMWISPKPESQANPMEEVPTVALAQSTTGLSDLTLEISVNGKPRKSVPIPYEPFDQPGKNILKVSLYMDELGVAPLDVVSYFLRGQRITDPKLPDITSDIQFIQVRPFRDDASHAQPPPDNTKDLNLLVQLKLAQLQSIKDNFVLAHTEVPATNPVRVRVNNRVGKSQGDLAAKTEQVAQTYVHDGLPAGTIDLLRQAEIPMNDASKKILAVQNVPAIPAQEKALNLIVQAEKSFHKEGAVDNPATPPPKPPDNPFKDKPAPELKKRIDTTAGDITQLAQNQIKLSRNIGENASAHASANAPAPTPAATDKPVAGNNPPGGQNNPPPAPVANPADAGKSAPPPAPQPADLFTPDPGTGTLSERQARVLQGIQTVLNTNIVLPPTVTAALQDAAKHAAESVRQLDQDNAADAREPAAAAAMDLRRAVSEMNDAGDRDTWLALEQAQNQLNDAAQKLRDIAKKGPPGSQQPGLSDLASQVRDVRQQLVDAANQQQEAGSDGGAQRLSQLATQIGAENVAPDLDGMAMTGLDVNKAMAIAQTLESLAGQAVQPLDPAGPSAEDIAALVNSLAASRENLARLAGKAGQAGQGQGQGQGPPDNQQGQGQGNGPSGNSNSSDAASEEKAYHEVIADVNDEAQQAAAAVHGLDTTSVTSKVADLEDNHFREANGPNVVRAYQALAPPLEKLISDLNTRLAQAQREDIVKPPDLDEAPPSYRAAVSDYFETLSRDYHPDTAGQDSPKP